MNDEESEEHFSCQPDCCQRAADQTAGISSLLVVELHRANSEGRQWTIRFRKQQEGRSVAA